MSIAILTELETSAQVILGPPNLVSPEQRQAAEKIFLEFRETKTPYILCRQILENSRIDFVLFETADLLKQAIIREWSLLQESDILSLRQYLLQYVIQKQVPDFVRDRILQVIAIIIKRNSVDDFGAERSKILGEVENLIINGDFQKQVMGLKLITILMEEYATTVKSTDVGLPWEVHFKAKKLFEGTDLCRIFQFCVRVISEIIKSDPPYPENTNIVLKHLLAIVEKVLTWGFIRRMYHIRMIGIFEKLYESDLAPSLKLNSTWLEILLDTQVLPLMFSIYWKVQNQEQLAHHALSNLVQFASLNGEIFNQKDSKLNVEYLHKYIEGFLNLIQSISFVGRECLGISRIVFNLVSFFSSVVMSQLPENVLKSFLENITLITCRFAEASSKDEHGTEDEKYHIDALDNMLDAWLCLFQNKEFIPKDTIRQCAIQMFNVYLQCHLAPPHGSRVHIDVEGEEIEEAEDNDRIKFKNQMQIIGVFGRNALDHSLILLCRLLEEKAQQLSAQLQKMQSQAMTINDSNALDNVFEDIHWLVLITGHVLCIDYEGESPQTPKEIMEYSVAELKAGRSNVEATLKAFASIQQCNADTDANIDQVDKAIRLTISVLKLCTMQSLAAEAKLGHFISPEVGCTLMWFLKGWSTSYYLLPDENFAQLSEHFLICFGSDTEGAEFVARFILTKIYSNIFHFHSEPILLQDTVDLFISLAEISRNKKSCIVKSEGFWSLVDLQSKIKPGVVPQSVKCGLLKGFVIAGASISDENSRKEYWQRVLIPIQSQFKNIICQENFNRIYQEEQVKSEIIDLLESFIGIASGMSISILEELFTFLSTILSELPMLLNLYHNYEIVVQLILKVFNECARHLLLYLSSENTKKLYEYCLSVVQVYARCNANRFTTDVVAEEDNFQDLMLLMMLLTELLSKDCVTFSENWTLPIAAADIVLYGINFILPLMTLDLLKYPSLCKQYYKLITFVTEMHPQKVCDLREELLKQLIMSVQMGFVQFSSDVLTCSLDFVESLAKHIDEKELHNTRVSQLVMPLLKELFDLILSHQINGDMISSASTALYALICCYPEEYKLYVRNLIQSQSDPTVAERLESAFTNLTPNVCREPVANKTRFKFGRRLQFRENFDKFITSVHSFLLIK